jgi:acyl carrier protein
MEQKLITVVAGVLGVKAAALSLETGPGDLEAWDSLAHINVVSEIEAEFGVSIPIEKIAELHAIRDFLPFLGQRS